MAWAFQDPEHGSTTSRAASAAPTTTFVNPEYQPLNTHRSQVMLNPQMLVCLQLFRRPTSLIALAAQCQHYSCRHLDCLSSALCHVLSCVSSGICYNHCCVTQAVEDAESTLSSQQQNNFKMVLVNNKPMQSWYNWLTAAGVTQDQVEVA